MAKTPNSSPDPQIVGNGGETHQTASTSQTRLTTNHGVNISDQQNSLKTGSRTPTLLEDFVLREKVQHFDRERIPERIVHARGSAVHGYFELSAQPLLDQAGVERDAGVIDVSADAKAWLAPAATRQWDREPKVRMLA